ncbi:MAG: ABC transporter permease [Thermoplasmata archaeon]
MKLRTYLVKRTIHMMITVLIVLVLLFVLYRMMPGSAAAQMMMNPRMSPNDIDIILVRYGFGRWADYPGEYVQENYYPETVGRYHVTVSAVGDNDRTETLSTYFDVNAPEDIDFVAPRILDVGISELNLTTKGVDFYLQTYDANPIKQTEIFILYPNNTYQNVTMSRDINAGENDTYGFSARAVLPYLTNPNFIATFSVQDTYRNIATAAIKFDASNAINPVSVKICNLSADIPFTNGVFTYPTIGGTVSMASEASGGTPTFSILMPDMELSSTQPTMSVLAGSYYSGTYDVESNGMLTFKVEIGDTSATLPFVVNSNQPKPFPVDGPDTYPLITDLELRVMGTDGRDSAALEYPFELSNLKLKVNVTAVDSDGKQCSVVRAQVEKPNGAESAFPLSHPRYVKMRTMAEQFVIYMKTMLVFDFGTSYIYQRPSWDVIIERMPSTALLFGTSLVISYLIGIIIGVVVAWRRGTALEMGTIVVTLFFYSMPIFWFALIMQWVFYAQLGWFPLGGMGGIEGSVKLTGLKWFLSVLHHLVMPLVTLVILGLAGTILLMRSAMLEVIGEDFTTTAKAKGLKERTVIFRHVARNAMLPVVTSMAMSIGSIISGGVLTETIFSWYGMGTLLIEGTLSKDFPVVQGAFYILALLTILGNMGADILYAWLDPRVQL